MACTLLCFTLLVVSFAAWANGNATVRLATARPGGDVTIICSTELESQDGLQLYVSLPAPEKVLYFNRDPPQLTVEKPFWGRVTTSGKFAALSVTISNLTAHNSGLYWCQYIRYNQRTAALDQRQGDGPVTMVYVTDPPISENLTTTRPPSHTSTEGCAPGGFRCDDTMFLVLAGLGASSLLVMCAILLTWVVLKVKRFLKKKGQTHLQDPDTLYEEMLSCQTPVSPTRKPEKSKDGSGLSGGFPSL